MKAYRSLILLTLTATSVLLLSSCNAPILRKTLGLPAQIINMVIGPITGR